MVLTKTKLLRELKRLGVSVESRYFKPSDTELDVFEQLLEKFSSVEVVESSRVGLKKITGDKVVLKPFEG